MKLSCLPFALALLLASAAGAQSFEQRHQQALAANPEGVRLEIRPGASPLRVGARIPLQLSFTNRSAIRYLFSGTEFDLALDVRDEEYFCEDPSALEAFPSYGAFSPVIVAPGMLMEVGPDPSGLTVRLDRWLRFDRPGRYRVYVVSKRVRTRPGPGVDTLRAAPKTASNILELEILAEDLAESARRVDAARLTLEAMPLIAPDPYPQAVEDALNDLRVIGSEAAVQLGIAFARRQGHPVDPRLLLGAHDPAKASALLDAYMAEPDVPVRSRDLKVRAVLGVLRQGKPWLSYAALPLTADGRQDMAAVEALTQRIRELEIAEARRLAPLVAAKQGAARAASANALRGYLSDAAPGR